MQTQQAKSMTASEFFEAALAKVESESIRRWATSEHNRPIWISIAQRMLDGGETDVNKLAINIVATAMG